MQNIKWTNVKLFQKSQNKRLLHNQIWPPLVTRSPCCTVCTAKAKSRRREATGFLTWSPEMNQPLKHLYQIQMHPICNNYMCCAVCTSPLDLNLPWKLHHPWWRHTRACLCSTERILQQHWWYDIWLHPPSSPSECVKLELHIYKGSRFLLDFYSEKYWIKNTEGLSFTAAQNTYGKMKEKNTKYKKYKTICLECWDVLQILKFWIFCFIVWTFSVEAGFLHYPQEFILTYFSISVSVCFINHLL